MDMKSTGILRYSPKLLGERASEKWWLVLDCDESIGTYLRHLYWLSKFRTQNLQRPAWREHVTAIRNEEPRNKQFWELYAGNPLDFEYNPVPQTNGNYWWVTVTCPMLLDIREELGLPREPLVPFHLSFGHEGIGHVASQ